MINAADRYDLNPSFVQLFVSDCLTSFHHSSSMLSEIYSYNSQLQVVMGYFFNIFSDGIMHVKYMIPVDL